MKAFVSTIIMMLFQAAVAFAAQRPSVVVRPENAPAYCQFDTTTIFEKANLAVQTDIVKKSLLPKHKEIPDIYSLPYSLTARHEKWGRLAANTGLLFGGGITALAVLQMLPEDATAWNKAAITQVPLFKRWVNNVKRGPHIDHDNPIFNFVMHPYAGAAYFMSARSQGFNFLGSFLYSAFISTVFWEYGIEAFMEIPSLQDLFITPVCGAIIGEGFYRVKRWLVDNGYMFLGSKAAGYVLAFLVDPVNEFLGYFRGNPAHEIAIENRKSNIATIPWFTNSIFGRGYGITVSYTF